MKNALPLILLAVVVALGMPAPPRAGAEDAAAPVLDRMLHLSQWGVSLDRTVRDIKEQTGVDVVFFLADLPPDETREENVYLVTGQVRLGTVLEALARRFGCRFRVTAEGRIELSRSYDWAGAEQSLAFFRTGLLADGEQPDAATGDFLREFVKPLQLLGTEHTLRLEPYPMPGDPGHLRGTVVMPGVLGGYLLRAVACLGGEAGDYPPPVRPDSRLFARAREDDVDWEKLLGRRVRTPRGVDIKAMLSDVADQAGVVVVLRGPPPATGGGRPEDKEEYTLGQVTEALAAGWNLGKRVFLSCGVVVFENGGEGVETDARSRELFWDGLAVAGFDAGAAAERLGPEALVAGLRREVYPGLWRDPVCSLVYNRSTGRLVAVAPANVVAAVASSLSAK